MFSALGSICLYTTCVFKNQTTKTTDALVYDNLGSKNQILIFMFWCFGHSVYWQFQLILKKDKQSYGGKSNSRTPEGFRSLWTLRVNPICISTYVSHDLVYPVKSDLLPVVLFQDVFHHLCVCAWWCVTAHQISPPFIPGQCGTTDRVDLLEAFRVSERSTAESN